jgi:ferritin-like metal-binding protein YciE
MSQSAKDIFIVGLRNAHAMEVQARELMERQIERTADYPTVQSKLKMHLDETNRQLQRLEECLDACGESTSTLKDTAQSIAANMMAMAHAMAGDEILKNTFANNGFENFEIAAYKSLLAMCDMAGVPASKPLLEQSLREEQPMAKWIEQNVEKVTVDYMRHEGVRAQAA